MLQSFERKTTQKGQKRRGLSFHAIRKIIRKRPDVCVNTLYHRPYNNTETCINTGFKQNCCHCFLSSIKNYPLPFLSFLLHPFLFTKCRKTPFYKALTEKMKHKNNEKGRRGLLCIYTERYTKNCSINHPKNARNAHFIRD